MKVLRDLIRIFWLPGAVFLLDQIALLTFASYDRYPWLDIPMHFIGGSAIGYSYVMLLNLFESRGAMGPMRRSVRILFIVSLVALTAVVWEWHEFIRDAVFGQKTQLGEADTMGDFFMGLLGGLASTVIFVSRK